MRRHKKASLSCDTERGCENKVGGDLLSRGCAVPSARLGLTSLFGMGRGDPQRYNHQNIVWTTQAELANAFVQATLAAAPAATAHLHSCTAHCTNFEQARPVRRGAAASFGQLVRLGFDIAVFTPASYQRHRL